MQVLDGGLPAPPATTEAQAVGESVPSLLVPPAPPSVTEHDKSAHDTTAAASKKHKGSLPQGPIKVVTLRKDSPTGSHVISFVSSSASEAEANKVAEQPADVDEKKQ